MTARLIAGSTEYVKVEVRATNFGVGVNPTADQVSMAFIVGTRNPTNADWQSASWETANSRYFARCLVGPAGSVNLTAGTYVVFVRITGAPEIPIKRAGILNVA